MSEENGDAFDVTKHFDENRAEIYDDIIRQAIPGYEALHHMARLFLHHDAPGGGQQGLLNSIAARLKPGAPLVLAHAYGDAGSEKYRHFMDVWRKWQLDAGISEEDVEKGFRHVEENCRFTTEERLLELLAEAGFRGAQSFYEALLFGGWIAWKAQPPGQDG